MVDINEIKDKLLDFYFKIEDKYYQFMDVLADKGIPVYKAIDAIEDRGVPSMPVFAAGLLAVILGVWFFAIAPMFAPEEIGVEGTTLTLYIMDANGDPVENAEITLTYNESEATQLTDSDGRAIFRYIEDGTEVTAVFAKEGFDEKTETFTVFDGMEKTVELEGGFLDFTGADLVLLEIVNENGNLITGNMVTLTLGYPDGTTETKKTTRGSSSISLKEYEKVTVTADVLGYLENTIDLKKSDLGKTIQLQMLKDGASGSVIVTVYDTQINAVTDADVSLYDKGNHLVGTGITGISGSTRPIEGIRAGEEVYAEVVAGGYAATRSDPITIKEGTNRITVKLDAADGVIKVTVTNSVTAEPVANASVTITATDNINLSASAYTDSQGVAALGAMDETTYNLRVSAEGYVIGSQDSVVIGEYDIALVPSDSLDDSQKSTITVNVTDALGYPLPGADVTLNEITEYLGIQFEQKVADGVTDANGTYLFDGVEAKTYKANAKFGSYGPTDNSEGPVTIEKIGDDATMKIRMGLTAVPIYIDVKDEDGAKVNNATVKIYKGDTLDATKTTDSNGRAVHVAYTGQSINLEIEKEGYATSIYGPVEVAYEGQIFTITLKDPVTSISLEKSEPFITVGGYSPAATSIDSGGLYHLNFILTVPDQDFGKIGFNAIIGNQNDVAKQKQYITDISASYSTKAYGTTYSSWSVDSANLNKGTNKYKWAAVEIEGNKAKNKSILIKVGFKPANMSIGEAFDFKYNLWVGSDTSCTIKYPTETACTSYKGLYDTTITTETLQIGSLPECPEDYCIRMLPAYAGADIYVPDEPQISLPANVTGLNLNFSVISGASAPGVIGPKVRFVEGYYTESGTLIRTSSNAISWKSYSTVLDIEKTGTATNDYTINFSSSTLPSGGIIKSQETIDTLNDNGIIRKSIVLLDSTDTILAKESFELYNEGIPGEIEVTNPIDGKLKLGISQNVCVKAKIIDESGIPGYLSDITATIKSIDAMSVTRLTDPDKNGEFCAVFTPITSGTGAAEINVAAKGYSFPVLTADVEPTFNSSTKPESIAFTKDKKQESVQISVWPKEANVDVEAVFVEFENENLNAWVDVQEPENMITNNVDGTTLDRVSLIFSRKDITEVGVPITNGDAIITLNLTLNGVSVNAKFKIPITINFGEEEEEGCFSLLNYHTIILAPGQSKERTFSIDNNCTQTIQDIDISITSVPDFLTAPATGAITEDQVLGSEEIYDIMFTTAAKNVEQKQTGNIGLQITGKYLFQEGTVPIWKDLTETYEIPVSIITELDECLEFNNSTIVFEKSAPGAEISGGTTLDYSACYYLIKGDCTEVTVGNSEIQDEGWVTLANPIIGDNWSITPDGVAMHYSGGEGATTEMDWGMNLTFTKNYTGDGENVTFPFYIECKGDNSTRVWGDYTFFAQFNVGPLGCIGAPGDMNDPCVLISGLPLPSVGTVWDPSKIGLDKAVMSYE